MASNVYGKMRLMLGIKLALLDQTRDTFFLERDDPQWEQTLMENFHILLDDTGLVDLSHFTVKNQKNEAASIKQREIGNNLTQRSDFRSAIEAYTRSISLAPHDSTSTALALSFANRGAVLKSMARMEESIIDTQRALDHGYPDHLKYKLYSRLGQCCQAIGKVDEAKVWFSKAKKSVVKSVLPKQEQSNLHKKLECDLQKCASSLGNLVIKKQKVPRINGFPPVSPAPPPNLSQGPSAESSCMSRKVGIKYTKTLGRHLVAAVDINPGDVLIVEPTNSFLLLEEFTWVVCSHCLLRCHTLLPCPHCTWCMYCSAECMTTAEKYHKKECAVVPFMKQHFTHYLIVALKVITAIGMEQFIKLAETYKFTKPTSEEEWRTLGFDENGKYPAGLEGVLSYYHTKQWTSLELMNSCIFTMTVSKVLGIDKLPSQFKLEAFILKLVHCFGIIKNWCVTEFEIRDEITRYGTLGCHSAPIINLMQHSCNPNLFIHTHKTTSVVRAIQVIPKGSLLETMYGRAFLRRTLHERKKYLELALGKPCTCEACVFEWPVWDDLPIAPIFHLPEEKNAMDSVSAGARLIMTNHFDDGFVVTKESLPVFLKQIIIMDKCNKKLNQRYFDMVEESRKYFAIQGNVFLNFSQY